MTKQVFQTHAWYIERSLEGKNENAGEDHLKAIITWCEVMSEKNVTIQTIASNFDGDVKCKGKINNYGELVTSKKKDGSHEPDGFATPGITMHVPTRVSIKNEQTGERIGNKLCFAKKKTKKKFCFYFFCFLYFFVCLCVCVCVCVCVCMCIFIFIFIFFTLTIQKKSANILKKSHTQKKQLYLNVNAGVQCQRLLHLLANY